MKARFFALAALVLGLASCQQDFNEPTMVGGEVDFQLAVAAPELTRADLDGDSKYGYDSAHGAIDYLNDEADVLRTDWTEVDLRYSLEVYDKANDYTNATPVKDRQVIIVDSYEAVTFDLRLVPNRDYHFVVFADFVPQGAADYATASIADQKELGLRHNIGENLGQITIKEDTINDEIADAYFATEDIKITNSAAQGITLRRPFGKVRVIATDLAELNLNVDPGKVKVEYDAYHPRVFNAVTGEVDGEYTQESYEYVYGATVGKASLADHLYTQYYDAMTKTNVNNVERHTHMTLFTDYILAEKEGQTPYHFTMTVYDKSGATIKETVFNTDIPVERNMLTTVIGNVLTTATEIKVTIDDNFKSEYNVNYVGVASARELQEALNNAKAGENNVINFEADIDAVAEEYNPIIITEIPETTIVLNGNGYKFNGCMEIIGKSEYKNATTIFEDIYFETNDETALVGSSFIYCNDQNGGNRYPDNVTIKDCKFKGTDNTVGASFRSLNGNVIVDGCQMFAGHSLMQLKSCGKAKVDVYNTTITAGRGIALGDANVVTIRNTEINAVSYGVRADGCTANTTIENATINANIPVVVRKLTTGEYTLNFAASNTLTAGNEGANTKAYQVVFTNGDDEATFVKPTGTFVANGAENFKVFPELVVDESNFVANDLEELMKWAYKAANSTDSPNLVLTADIELPKKAIVADHVNKTYTFTGEDIVVVNGIPSGNNWPAISDYETSLNPETGVYEYYGGVIDGDGHTIKGLRINHDLVASGFLCWTKDAKVDNLTFDDAVVYNKGGQYGETYTGTIIGRCWDGSHVNNCHVTNSSVLGKNEVGGIVGRVYRRTIKTNTPDGQAQHLMEKMAYVTYCTTDENTTVKGISSIGGIVGMNYGCIVGQCINNAQVSATGDYAGGIAGYHRSYTTKTDGYIIACRSTDKATITAKYAGGVAGYVIHDKNHLYAKSWIVGCASESTISGTTNSGGIIGNANNGTITSSWALNNGATKLAGRGTATNNASYIYNNATDATQADIDAMNAAIEAFNVSDHNVSLDGTVGAVMLKRWALVNGVPVLQ